MYDHFTQRGYVENVPGAPMCGCVEQMPVVTRSDCTQLDVTQNVAWSYNTNTGTLTASMQPDVNIAFNACDGGKDQNGNNRNDNDLYAYYQRLLDEGKVTAQELASLNEHLVGKGVGCEDSILDLLEGLGWELNLTAVE